MRRLQARAIGAVGVAALAACAGAYRAGRDGRVAIAPSPSSSAPADIDVDASSRASADAAVVSRASGPEGVRLVLPPDGTIGAYLVAGPFEGPSNEVTDSGARALAACAPVLAALAASDDAGGASPRIAAVKDGGVLDLATTLDVRPGRWACAGGRIRATRPGRHVVLLGVDDGVTVLVDGRSAYSHETARVRRDDDDLVALDLAPGDHAIVFALHRQRDGRDAAHPWALRARWIDRDRATAPAAWSLPRTTADDARALLPALARLSLDRGMTADGYEPRLLVRFGAGFPEGQLLDVAAKLIRVGGGDGPVDTRFPAIGVPVTGEIEASVPLPVIAADAVEGSDWSFDVDAGGRKVEFPFHPRKPVREAVAHASRAIAATDASSADAASRPVAPESIDSVRFLRDRLARFVAHGDGDLEAQLLDARELDELAAVLDQGHDPYVGSGRGDGDAPLRRWRTGAMRRAYRSPVDDQLSEFAVYVPPDFDPRRTYPLIVALHGMNGRPLEMLMWLFGHDDPDRDGNWEDRHPRRDLETLEAIVVAPDGHFNAMYRDLGEDDVMRVVDWAMATYPIDPSRVTITGPSMGGIGSAACALHHPDRFAAAAPLCGYHSYFVRSDIEGRTLRPWERFIAEKRSNVFWAENGQYLPLFVVHGTKDLPEENSGVLIDRYTELKYPIEHEHPELGHNVWQTTYEDLKGAKWLLEHRRPMHPRVVRFKTPSPRWGDDAWVHVRELAASGAWGEVLARIEDRSAVRVTTHGVASLALDRDPAHVDDAAPLTVTIDGQSVAFQAGEPVELHLEPRVDGGSGGATSWAPGPRRHEGPCKCGRVTGPIHDVFHEPILFVWGAQDPAQARANEEVARAWARVHAGVRVDYPVVSDVEFWARGEALANERALFLVGNPQSNSVLRTLDDRLPIHVDGSAIVAFGQRVEARDGTPDRSQLGAMFIRPNPVRPERYLVVVEGVGPLGAWRSLSLPDMLPDYVVYDEGVEPARGGLLLGPATLRAAGLFDLEWSAAPNAIASLP